MIQFNCPPMSPADHVQIKAFRRFLREVGSSPGHVHILDHRWILYVEGGPEPPLFWEGD